MDRIINLDSFSEEDNKSINKYAKKFNTDYSKFIDTITVGNSKNLNYIFSSICSKNPYQSKFYYRALYISYIINFLNETTYDRVIIIHSDYLLHKEFNSLLPKFPNLKSVCKCRVYTKISLYISTFFKASRFFIRLTLRFLAHKRPQKHSYIYNKPLTIIDTFILSGRSGPGTYGENFNDRYYPNLYEGLNRKGDTIVKYAPCILGQHRFSRLFKKLRRDSRFLVTDDFLFTTDFLHIAYTVLFRRNLKINQTKCFGFNVKRILLDEFQHNAFDDSILNSHIIYSFYKNLSAHDITIKSVVDWYENQNIDKALNLAINKFHKDTYCIGYQGFLICPTHNFYLNPTIIEKDLSLCPDKIAVVSNIVADNLTETSVIKIVTAPGFRFVNFKTRQPKKVPNNKVLVCLPIDENECLNIIKFCNILKNSFKSKREFRFSLRPHPCLNVTKLKKVCDNISFLDYEFNKGELLSAFDNHMFLIGNTSSTLVEGLLCGLYVIVAPSQNRLTQNPIPNNFLKDNWTIGYDIQDCIANMRKTYLNDQRKTISSKNITDMISPVNKTTLDLFIREIKG